MPVQLSDRVTAETWPQMSHPDPNGPADPRPIKVGEVWENPVIGERATILELPRNNPAGRATGELTALVGARVMGEHRHPALVEQFPVPEGELTVKRNEHTSTLRQGETVVIEPGVWHDWWNTSDRDARALRAAASPLQQFGYGAVNEANRDRALTHRRSDALHTPRSHVANSKHARQTRLQHLRRPG